MILINKYGSLLLAGLAVLILASCSAGKRALVKGYNSFEGGEYDVAIGHYQKALDEGMEAGEANYKIAEAYRLSNRLQEALPYYETAIDMGVADTAAVFHYAMALKQNSRYDDARAQLQEYLKLSSDTTLEHTARARQEVNNLDLVQEITSKDAFYEIEDLTAVNTAEAEYAPVVHRGEFYFTSSRGNSKVYKGTGTAFTNIFKAPMNGDSVAIQQAQTLGEEFTTDIVNEGAITFSPDGRMMVFARGNSGKRKGTNDVNLYMSFYKQGKWTTPQLMTISDVNAWDSTPAFSRDGKTLYFSSNRPGGQGGKRPVFGALGWLTLEQRAQHGHPDQHSGRRDVSLRDRRRETVFLIRWAPQFGGTGYLRGRAPRRGDIHRKSGAARQLYRRRFWHVVHHHQRRLLHFKPGLGKG